VENKTKTKTENPDALEQKKHTGSHENILLMFKNTCTCHPGIAWVTAKDLRGSIPSTFGPTETQEGKGCV
jgi:hypothetical protein